LIVVRLVPNQFKFCRGTKYDLLIGKVTGANPTIASFNASIVNFYNANG
jgi:hypothetical protein